MAESTGQLIEFAQQFFNIANAITAFTVLQAVALMHAFKDTKVAAAFLRWRPYTSILYRYAVNGYIIAVVGCGIAEFCLRWAGGQSWQPLGACVIAVVLRCVAIFLIGSVHCKIFVAVCREQNWLNQYRKEDREFQTPRVLHEYSKREQRLHKFAMKADEKLFGAPQIRVVHAEDFDRDRTGIKFALCIRNEECKDLQCRKLYLVLSDEAAAANGYLHVIDESGKEHRYPQEYFLQIELPKAAEKMFLPAA
ncbi:MAG TPA: hypothetical protein VE980_02925 [Pyrinomonadaceae bacterium]|nr:hypothetical protein [Pyrinomonadaceae bacterium]